MIKDFSVWFKGETGEFDNLATVIKQASISRGMSLTDFLNAKYPEALQNPAYDDIECNSLLVLAAVLHVETTLEECEAVSDCVATGAIIRNGFLNVFGRGNDDVDSFCENLVHKSPLLTACSFQWDIGELVVGDEEMEDSIPLEEDAFHIVLSGDSKSMLKLVNMITSAVFGMKDNLRSVRCPNRMQFTQTLSNVSDNKTIMFLIYTLCNKEGLQKAASLKLAGTIQAWSMSASGALGAQCVGVDYESLTKLAKIIVEHSELVNTVNILGLDGAIRFSYTTGGEIQEVTSDNGNAEMAQMEAFSEE